MARPLQPYHYAWLSKHPERTKDWLRFALKAGFDIHHMDGDHSNNDPDNLILIEHVDHMRLHGNEKANRNLRASAQRKRRKQMLEEGRRAYEAALFVREDASYLGGVWQPAAKLAELPHAQVALSRAKLWAIENGLEWPLVMIKASGSKVWRNNSAL